MCRWSILYQCQLYHLYQTCKNHIIWQRVERKNTVKVFHWASGFLESRCGPSVDQACADYQFYNMLQYSTHTKFALYLGEACLGSVCAPQITPALFSRITSTDGSLFWKNVNENSMSFSNFHENFHESWKTWGIEFFFSSQKQKIVTILQTVIKP